MAAALAGLASLYVALAIERVWTLLIPVTVAVAPILMRGRAGERTVLEVSSILLLAFVILGSASVGFLYIPSFLAMLAAATRARPSGEARPGQSWTTR